MQLHTTRSWDFMGFIQQVDRSTLESDIIIGVLDSGIWPEADSFSVKGFGPPPTKWKGTCEGTNFTCNNKIIGAKFYRSDGEVPIVDYPSPRDAEGHGTHTSSTAAGALVINASLYGLGKGSARGGVPSARIAVYKICWSDGCSSADILAAFDDAIADGVDIISISVGGENPNDYFNDPIAIGSFQAMRKGILTSNSAGNSGPELRTITNFSPWSLSVAASTIDRKFIANVKLGNGEIYEGIAKNTFDLNNVTYPLIYGGDAPNTSAAYTWDESRQCLENSLDRNLVEGKVVLCDGVSNATGPWFAGAVGSVMQDSRPKDTARSFPLPASNIEHVDGNTIYTYMNSASNPTATIMKSVEKNETRAPYVPSFSSRGPNPYTPNILKPDISAPGVDILAAWSPVSSVTGLKGDNRFPNFNIISGTSMSCPHATAVAAYVKSYNPTWSPAAIKSAIMTTATLMNSTMNTDAEFAYGSGHINPLRAINPGLVYDAGESDYIKFLCGQGYSTNGLQLITGDNSTCSSSNSEPVENLNYPSFAIYTSSTNVLGSFTRIVTNVGAAKSTYKAIVKGVPSGLEIVVNPDVLSFEFIDQKISYTLKIEGEIVNSMISASLVWDDGTFQVRSPIVVLFSG
ncbi:hypothetical protein ACFE04_013601 [Oxalis oulophora]